ncbi:aminotransferase class V-fold PLP-dependent enzyme [candidate division KSB1 bacterium]|nr:aminotransferase class V-fold PLP-dependent enzyme [candidate division KSB1 bacterium]
MNKIQDQFQTFRKIFPAYDEGIYVNHAAVSPFSTLTRDVLQKYWENRAHFPVDVYPDILEKMQRLKFQITGLIHAESADQIVLMPNTGYGLNAIATGLKWKPGDHILLIRDEFPTNIYPFLNLEKQGVLIDWIEPVNSQITPEMIHKQLHPNTRMLSISFVQFLTGFRADLEAIGQLCRDQNIFFIVDGIQGTGVCPIDVQKWQVDGWACGGHKWLMWPMGTGFLYVSPRLLDQLQPAYAGWVSVKNAWNMLDYNLDFLESADKFTVGGQNFMGFSVAETILNKFVDLDVVQIHTRIEALTTQLIEALKELPVQLLTPKDPNLRAGIVSLRISNPDTIQKKLQEQGIIAAARGDVLRFSPHCTNQIDEMDRIVEVLKELI